MLEDGERSVIVVDTPGGYCSSWRATTCTALSRVLGASISLRQVLSSFEALRSYAHDLSM